MFKLDRLTPANLLIDTSNLTHCNLPPSCLLKESGLLRTCRKQRVCNNWSKFKQNLRILEKF